MSDQAITKDNTKRNIWRWFSGVLILALIERVCLLLIYPPVSYSDTGSYRRLAETILNGWKNYDGTRTPAYPVFLAILGDDQHVVMVQMVLGILITLIFFYMGYRISRSIPIAFLVALGHTLNLNQLFFESNLLTETLATFFIMASLLGAVVWILDRHKRSVWLGLFIGITASIAALTRPLFVFLPFTLAGFLTFFAEGFRIRFDWKPLVSIFLAGALINGAWVYYIHDHFYQWSMSSMSGYNTVQHTGYYFEYVPDKFAALRDTYIQYRDARIQKYGSQGNAIWEAIPAMQAASGYSFYEMSALLSHISMELIREHPGLYLKYVIQGWWMFWLAPVYFVKANMHIPAIGLIIQYLVYLERAMLIGANALFVVTSLLGIISKKLRSIWKLSTVWGMLGTVIWVCSVFQTLLDHGDNPRFLVPLQSVVVFWAIWILYQMFNRYRANLIGRVKSKQTGA